MEDDLRSRIDPGSTYPSDGLRAIERKALAVLEVLPPGCTVERTRDAIQIEEGGGHGLVLLLTMEALEVRFPFTDWTVGSHGPARCSRLWKRFRWMHRWDDALSDMVVQVLAEARRARLAEFRPCGYCGERFAPEHMMSGQWRDGPICHACASSHEQVVF